MFIASGFSDDIIQRASQKYNLLKRDLNYWKIYTSSQNVFQ